MAIRDRKFAGVFWAVDPLDVEHLQHEGCLVEGRFVAREKEALFITPMRQDWHCGLCDLVFLSLRDTMDLQKERYEQLLFFKNSDDKIKNNLVIPNQW